MFSRLEHWMSVALRLFFCQDRDPGTAASDADFRAGRTQGKADINKPEWPIILFYCPGKGGQASAGVVRARAWKAPRWSVIPLPGGAGCNFAARSGAAASSPDPQPPANAGGVFNR
jgi:hypothetical protein